MAIGIEVSARPAITIPFPDPEAVELQVTKPVMASPPQAAKRVAPAAANKPPFVPLTADVGAAPLGGGALSAANTIGAPRAAVLKSTIVVAMIAWSLDTTLVSPPAATTIPLAALPKNEVLVSQLSAISQLESTLMGLTSQSTLGNRVVPLGDLRATTSKNITTMPTATVGGIQTCTFSTLHVLFPELVYPCGLMTTSLSSGVTRAP